MNPIKASQNCGEDYNVLNSSLPTEYKKLTSSELVSRIHSAKKKLGNSVVILGHHYQRDEIVMHADYRGDSLKLAQLASQHHDAQFIIFCGVHFMAESADILSQDNQIVILPNMDAGCSMADMANPQQVMSCWNDLRKAGLDDIIPVTYINCSASLKGFVGERGGVVCTSSNAPKIVDWALKQGKHVLFFPDQHLGRITAYKAHIPLEDMVLWDPNQKMGGNEAHILKYKRVILWKGHCSVHSRFNVEQINKARLEYPGIKIIVHPECPMDVVMAADMYGSTEYIVKTIRESETGSQWAVGTEVNLVSRLQDEMPDKMIYCLDPIVCPCSTMYRIHPAYLCWVLEGLVNKTIINQVKVDEPIRSWAKISLEKMMELSR